MFDDTESKKEILSSSIVLLVDDDENNSKRLCSMFESFGFSNITQAKNYKESWDFIMNNSPDIIIVDTTSNNINAIDLVKNIRLDAECKDTPVLAQISSKSAKNKEILFQAGITDYITKPFDYYEIYARCILHLEKGYQNKELRTFYKRLKGELAAAQSLINDSLPSKSSIKELESDYGIDLSVKFESTSEMGGDLWGFFKVSESCLGIYTIDLAGHGIESCLNALRMHSIMHSNLVKYDDLDKVVSWINKKMYSLLPVGKFATMFCGLIDTENDLLTYVTAATTEPAILKKDSDEPILLSGKGYPIGVRENFDGRTDSISFCKGDTLILYSDAIIEENSKDGQIFGEKKLYDIFDKIAKGSDYTSKHVLNVILDDFYKECSKSLKDDLTINVYHRSE